MTKPKPPPFQDQSITNSSSQQSPVNSLKKGIENLKNKWRQQSFFPEDKPHQTSFFDTDEEADTTKPNPKEKQRI